MNITHKRMWVVRNPNKLSILNDIVFPLSLESFPNYIRGTDRETYDREKHTFYDNDIDAFKDAKERLRKLKENTKL